MTYDYLEPAQNPLTNLRGQIREHWAKYRPKMFAEMEANGTLDAAIENAAKLTEEAVLDYQPEGLTPAQAFWAGWEVFRHEWAFLPAEEGYDASEEDDPEYEAYMKRMRQYSAERTVIDIWDAENERWITPFIWDEEKEALAPTGEWDDVEEVWTPAPGYEHLFPIEKEPEENNGDEA